MGLWYYNEKDESSIAATKTAFWKNWLVYGTGWRHPMSRSVQWICRWEVDDSGLRVI